MIICYHVAALVVEELAAAAITGGCDYYLL